MHKQTAAMLCGLVAAFVCCDRPGVTVEKFRVIANVPTQGYAQDIWVSENRAYVADGQAGLAVFDITNPRAPELLGVVTDSANEAWGVTAGDGLAYVAYGYKELLIADVANPDSMAILGELEYPTPGFGYDIAYADSTVYIAADAQFIIVDVTDPVHPNLVFQYRYPRGLRGICLGQGRCFLGLEQLGIAVWDVESLPPTQLGSLDTPANCRGVAVQGAYLYAADGRGGLVVIDVADPSNPVAVRTVDLPGYANRVSVQDSLVYVGCGDAGIAVVNIADQRNPELAASISTSYTRAAVEQNGYVYACDRDLGLVVVEKEE